MKSIEVENIIIGILQDRGSLTLDAITARLILRRNETITDTVVRKYLSGMEGKGKVVRAGRTPKPYVYSLPGRYSDKRNADGALTGARQ